MVVIWWRLVWTWSRVMLISRSFILCFSFTWSGFAKKVDGQAAYHAITQLSLSQYQNTATERTTVNSFCPLGQVCNILSLMRINSPLWRIWYRHNTLLPRPWPAWKIGDSFGIIRGLTFRRLTWRSWFCLGRVQRGVLFSPRRTWPALHETEDPFLPMLP